MIKQNPFKKLTRFEWTLWIFSLLVIFISSLFSGPEGLLSGIASLIGVTALIFIAKGMVLGQITIIIFAVFYGIVSFAFKYYGEVITYLGMSAPMALLALISWIKNPFGETGEVKVRERLTFKQILVGVCGALFVTLLFYFILKELGNASLIVSTFSVTTSFFASYLVFLRSPYYALAYTVNDIVLIVLWIVAAAKDLSCIPMIFCFIMFFINDLYGFYNWKRMQKRQSSVG